MKIHQCVFALAACLPLASYGQGDQDINQVSQQNDRHENLLRIEAAQHLSSGNASAQGSEVGAAATGYCVQPPFPSVPTGTVYQATVTYVGGVSNVKVWRIGCDATNSNVLVRVEPVTQSPFICSSSLKVLQNGDQYDARLAESTSSSSSFCDDLLVPKTFLLGQWSFDVQFNDDAAFTIVWGNANINVGAYSGQAAGCAQGGISRFTPATGIVDIPSVELPTGDCYDVQLLRVAPFDSFNFTLVGATKK